MNEFRETALVRDIVSRVGLAGAHVQGYEVLERREGEPVKIAVHLGKMGQWTFARSVNGWNILFTQ